MLVKLRLLLFISFFLVCSPLYAFSILIDTNGYTGYYRIDSGAFVSGNQSFNLSSGTHVFEHLPGSISFSVDGSGNVTSLQAGSATGSGSSLVLTTTVVQIDPQSFPGTYTVYNYPGTSGVQNFTLITNSQHRVVTSTNGMVTNFQVDSSGAITGLSDPDNVIVNTSEIVLKNVSVTIDPGNYTGTYQINDTNYTGIQTVTLLCGMDRIRTAWTGTIADIIVEDDGTITNFLKTNLIIEPNKVTFKTVPLTIYPGYYYPSLGYYLMGYEGAPKNGEHLYHVVPEASNRLTVGIGYIFENFEIDDQGELTWTPASFFASQKNSIFIKNQNIHFEHPTSYPDYWQIPYVTGYQFSDLDLYVIPNFSYQFLLNGTTFHSFTVTDCVSDVNVSTSIGTFVVSCLPNEPVKLVNTNVDVFMPLEHTFQLQHINSKFSSDINDFDITVNGDSVTLSSTNVTDYLFLVEDVLQNGRNYIEVSGEDENANPFTRSYTIWAGGAEVTVGTHGATDTVTLTVEQIIGGTKYTKSIVQEAVANQTIFKNVPQIEDGVVYISTERGKKTFRSKLPTRSVLHL